MRFDTCNAVTHIDMTQTAFEVSTIPKAIHPLLSSYMIVGDTWWNSRSSANLRRKATSEAQWVYQLRLRWRSRQNSWKLCLPRNDCIIQEYVVTVGRLSRWQYVCPTGVSIRMKLPSLEREMNLRSIPRYFSMLTTPHIPQDMFSIRSMLWCDLG